MNTDPIRSDDERPEPEGDERAASLRPLGGQLGAALAHLKGNIEKKRSAAPQAREPEEKPFVLPLYDEEALAEIADPHEREQNRRSRIAFYKQYPNAYAHYMERNEQIKAERNKVVMLQPWADDKRAAPNAVFRSALFPALNNKQGRRYVENHKVSDVY